MSLREIYRVQHVETNSFPAESLSDASSFNVDVVAVLNEAGGLERNVELHPLPSGTGLPRMASQRSRALPQH